MTTALLPHDPHLDTLFAARLLCDVCQRQPWTQLAQFCTALLCADCAQGEPEPEE
jgi:hypothetical protein